MELGITVAAGVVGVLITLAAMGIGVWILRTAVSLLRKLVMVSLVMAMGAGLVIAMAAAAWMSTH